MATHSASTAATDEALRVRIASGADTPPEVLQVLAADARVTVRAAVALNGAAPPGADHVLADDSDQRVRTLLARKLALLVPQLSIEQRDHMREQTLTTLAGLVQDEAVRVRTAIADVLKDMPQAPREMILRLAQDSAVPVSEPVIRLSPLLTPEDLLALLARPPCSNTAVAIARRPNLNEAISDAIAATADSAAITALLSNESAAIREATLDALIARAAAHEEWHDPLVRRPKLTGRAARALSEMVTTHLLGVLASRTDLDPGLAADLQRRLSERLDEPGSSTRAAIGPTGESADEALAAARALQARGRLDEASVLGAARRGDARACGAMLAVAADVTAAVVERAAALRSAKGVVSLVWAAGFSMKAGLTLQSVVGKIAPGAILGAGAGGDFPLAVEEMRWQIDLLKRMTR